MRLNDFIKDSEFQLYSNWDLLELDKQSYLKAVGQIDYKLNLKRAAYEEKIKKEKNL